MLGVVNAVIVGCLALAFAQYGAHGATDVTGFGIIGHARNLAQHQKASVNIELHTLPVIRGMMKADVALKGMLRLKDGYSAETSGGLLVCLPADVAEVRAVL